VLKKALKTLAALVVALAVVFVGYAEV